MAVETQLSAEDSVGIGRRLGEELGPEAVTENDGRLVLGQAKLSRDGAQLEDLEEVDGDEPRLESPFSQNLVVEDAAFDSRARHELERLCAAGVVLEIGEGEVAEVADEGLGALRVDLDHLRAAGQRAPDHQVHQVDERGRGTECDTGGHHDDARDRRAASDRAQGVAQLA